MEKNEVKDLRDALENMLGFADDAAGYLGDLSRIISKCAEKEGYGLAPIREDRLKAALRARLDNYRRFAGYLDERIKEAGKTEA